MWGKDITNMDERTYHFERLTPINDVDLNVYEEAINYVFNNSDIRNVAISGAYSAGKSSILASYERKHSNLRFLHISLAHFEYSDYEEGTEIKESVLEGKILNQLIHQIPSENIPQTNFRVKKKISKKDIISLTFEVVSFVIMFIHFTCFDVWKKYVNALPKNLFKHFLMLSTHQYALIGSGIALVVIFSIIVYKLICTQKNKNVFRKLNLQGNEIEIFEESDDSYFDKYLNEVLYLFENAEADVIVFEDIDRFNANRIFERLREVNTLANIQLQKEENRILRFFYLLRDDIFYSKDRTKFFDYIVPVIPVVDSSNSYDQFISHFKNSGIFEKFDESFLHGLSLYIDDMRLLKNIYNEFVIYFNRLNTTELDCNKMLAIITYKNLFPRDFAELQLSQGFVYAIFNGKDSFIEAEIKEMKEDIVERKQKLSALREENLISMRELNAAFAYEYLSDHYYWTDKNDNDLSYFVINNLSGNNKKEYLYRKQILEDKLSGKIDQLDQEISALEQKIIEIKNQQLHQIITRDNIDKIFSIKSTNEVGEITNFNELKSSEYFDLLKYLIRNGYIDETYPDYMTYFYENSLNRIDKTYLRSVTDKKSKEYTYRLKNPMQVISRLRLVDFDQEEILNFDLITCLLQTPQYYIKYIDRVFNQLKETNNFKFVGAYFDITTEMPEYIKHLNIIWPELFNIALEEKSLLDNQIRKYSIFSIYYSDEDVILQINQNNCLRDYISNTRDYLAIDDPVIDKLINGFSLLGVHFIGFDYEIVNIDLFNAVYENSLYEINEENLRLMQKVILGVKSDEDINSKNYTILLSNNDSIITHYMNQNINEYLETILQMSEGNILDDEYAVLALLNNPSLILERKKSYISALRTVITSIKEIEDNSLWTSLLDADIVEYSECNIMDCFESLKLSESVVSYINRCDSDLDFSKTEYDEDMKKSLFESVIISHEISNLKYKQILMSLKYDYDNFDIVGISGDKIIILIDVDIIRMTVDNLKFMRENYINQKFYYIHKNIDEYIDIMQEALFSKEELLEILTWNISDELKMRLLRFTEDEISIIGKGYSPAICLYILENNFEDTDLLELCSSFDQWDESIQAKIFDLAVNNIEIIINNPNHVSERLKNSLLYSDIVTRDEKIELFIAIMPELCSDRLKEILTLLNLTDYLKIFDTRSRPKFRINDENEKLLAAFKENNLIDNYQINPKKEGYYKISRLKKQHLL